MLLLLAAGCADGPFYGIKQSMPWIRSQWKADEALGPTDQQRRDELEQVARQLPRLSPEEQVRWIQLMGSVVAHDQSPMMRQQAVRAVAKASHPSAMEVILEGAKDKDSVVRMAACDVMATRKDPEATTKLAELAGGDLDQNVQLAAIRGLSQHSGSAVDDAMRQALESNDPMVRLVAMESMREQRGADYGKDPAAWIAVLDGQNPPKVSWTEKLWPWR
jgi:hypothetical protein